MEISDGSVVMVIKAARLAKDADGFPFVERRAFVTLRFGQMSGIRLEGDSVSILSALLIRQLPETPQPSDWSSCNGPVAGDIEAVFDTAYGLWGAIYAKTLAFELEPMAEEG